MVNITKEALDQTGLDGELIDLRWLDRASIDWDTIGESIKKTNSVVIVEQGVQGTSYGGWLSDEIQRRFFDHLDQPVQRVHGREASPSISKVLERASIAGLEEVVAGFEPREGRVWQKLLATQIKLPEVAAGATHAVISSWQVAVGDQVVVRPANS